jgi:hypothetical protein
MQSVFRLLSGYFQNTSSIQLVFRMLSEFDLDNSDPLGWREESIRWQQYIDVGPLIDSR